MVDRHLDSAVAVLVVFNEVHVFVDIANHIGANKLTGKSVLLLFMLLFFRQKNQSIQHRVGFKDTLSMPCCISHLAKSGGDPMAFGRKYQCIYPLFTGIDGVFQERQNGWVSLVKEMRNDA